MAKAYEGLYFDMPLCLKRQDSVSDDFDLTNIYKGVSNIAIVIA